MSPSRGATGALKRERAWRVLCVCVRERRVVRGGRVARGLARGSPPRRQHARESCTLSRSERSTTLLLPLPSLPR